MDSYYLVVWLLIAAVITGATYLVIGTRTANREIVTWYVKRAALFSVIFVPAGLIPLIGAFTWHDEPTHIDS